MSLKSQSMLIFLSSLVQLAFGTLASILLAHYLGPEGKGISYIAFFIPSLVTSLGSLSLGEAVTFQGGRGVPPRRIAGNTIVQSLLLGGLYALVAVACIVPLKATTYRDVPTVYALIGLAVLPLMMLKALGDGVLVGIGRIREFVIGNLALHSTRAILLFTGLVVFKLGLPAAVAADFGTWVLVGGYYFWAMQRGHGFDWRLDWPLTKAELRYGGQLHIGNMAQRLNLQLGQVILSSISGAGAVGLYSVAVSLAQILWYIPDAVGRILLPRVAGSAREEAKRVTVLACRNTVLLTALASLGFYLAGKPLIRLMYGQQFAPSVQPLFLLLPGIVTLSISKVLTKYLSGVGKPILNSVCSIAAFVTNVPLLLLLIPGYGIRGAAIASSVAYTVYAVVAITFFSRESHSPWHLSIVPSFNDIPLYREALAQIWRRLRGRASS